MIIFTILRPQERHEKNLVHLNRWSYKLRARQRELSRRSATASTVHLDPLRTENMRSATATANIAHQQAQGPHSEIPLHMCPAQ